MAKVLLSEGTKRLLPVLEQIFEKSLGLFTVALVPCGRLP